MLHSEGGEAWRDCRIVIPEYRGQFASTPLVTPGVSVEKSAADVSALAKSLSIERASLLCWSTGVQVGLQLALDRPDLIESMVLIQGTTGEALTCIGQPLCTIPGMPTMMARGLVLAPAVLVGRGYRQAMYSFLLRHGARLESLSRFMLWFFGTDFIFPIGIRYAQDMLHSDSHFTNYCGYAEGLGRHKILQRLPEIKAPALVVTGTPDFVTPARCSYDLAARLGGPAELFDDFSGSHYYILEEPHKLAREMTRFLAQRR